MANDAALAVSGTIYPGLNVAGEPVGGLSIGEAERKLSAALKSRKEKPLLILHSGEKKWEVPWTVVAEQPEPSQLARQAFAAGRTGPLLQRLHAQFLLKNGEFSIQHDLSANAEKLKAIAMAAAAAVDRKPVDASVTEVAEGIRISDDKPGLKTDVAATVRNMQQAVATASAGSVALVTTPVPARIATKDLQEITGLLSAFSTTFNRSDENRSRNIEIASQALSGVLVKQGEVFSFNDRVGLRTPENGYLHAMTLTSTGPVMDWGGGVCQVSTTLYNAALLADFNVVERSTHFDPPAYVPLGQDATVADGQIDLKMKNMRASPAYIKSMIDGDTLEVRIFGKVDKASPTVRIESAERTVHVMQTIVKQDSTLPLGQEVVESPGSNGFNVTVYRVKLLGNREISREKISTDEFAGSDRVVRVGTRRPGDPVVK